jgi:hypothetical protein
VEKGRDCSLPHSIASWVPLGFRRFILGFKDHEYQVDQDAEDGREDNGRNAAWKEVRNLEREQAIG